MDKDDQGPATSDDTEDERRERGRERESENERRRKALGQAGRTGRKNGPGRQTTRSPLQDRAGLPGAGPGSLTTTNLDGSTNWSTHQQTIIHWMPIITLLVPSYG